MSTTAGRPRPAAVVRTDDTGRTLATRAVVAYLTGRHVDSIRDWVPAVACDAATRAALVDVAQAERILEATPRRKSRSTE